MARKTNWKDRRTAPSRSLRGMVRARRLKKIAEAKLSIEDAMLELRKPNPTLYLHHDKAFGWLYYLERLAKQAP